MESKENIEEKDIIPRISNKNTFYRFSSIDNITLNKTRKNVVIRNDKFKIKGWAIDKHTIKPAKEVKIIIDGVEYDTTYGLNRKAVSERFNSEELLKSGFVRTLHKADFSKGIHEISIKILSSDSKEWYIKPLKQTFFTIK